jgi:Zn-dependent protease
MRNTQINLAIKTAVKFGPKLWSIAFKLAKGAKFTKFALFGASAASYAWLWSWQFSCMVLFALCVHEAGHVSAMRWNGVATKGFYLIPFVGGAAVASEAINDREKEFWITLWGPLFGLVSALLPLGTWCLTRHPLAAGVAGWIALFNLINLLPVTPLDGGRIVKSIAFSTGQRKGLAAVLAGLLFGALLLGLTGAMLLGALLLIGLLDLWFEWARRGETVPAMQSPGRGVFLYLWLCFFFLSIAGVASSVPEAQLALDALKD